MLAVMPQQTNPTRNPEIEITRMMSSRHEITEVVEEPPAQVAAEDKIYVAVGKELKENESTVLWALHNSGGRKICLLHVHEPAQWIPLTGTKFPVSQAEEHQVNAYRETNRLLRAYSMICERAGVSADVVHTGKDSIEKVTVELISQHGIKMLVLGAAADKCYSRKMTQTKSKKATYVRLQAPLFCRILFVCKGRLIHTREGGLEGSSLRSRSARERPTSSGPVYRRTSSFSSRGVMDNDSDLTSLVSSDPGSESRVLEGVMDCELYDQLKKAMAEADNSRGEDFEESKRRRKAENDVIDAIRRAKTSESLHAEEMRKRKEYEEELRIAQEHKSSLENQIASSNQMILELEQNMFSTVEMLEKYKKERDDLQVERDKALEVAEELRKKQAMEASNALTP